MEKTLSNAQASTIDSIVPTTRIRRPGSATVSSRDILWQQRVPNEAVETSPPALADPPFGDRNRAGDVPHIASVRSGGGPWRTSHARIVYA